MTSPVTIGNATLHLSDCLEILPTIGKVDAVVTDPPYGVGFQYASHDDSLGAWRRLFSGTVTWARENATIAVLPSCQIKQLPWIYANHAPDWLICWYKGSPGHAAYIGFNDWEPTLVYGKPKGLQMHDYFHCTPTPFDNGHPCPKPDGWAKWLVDRVAKPGQTVIDPFMGSGTTGVACAKLGRRFIGIEIEEKYFQIACRRIEQAYAQPDMFIAPPEKAKQEAMLW